MRRTKTDGFNWFNVKYQSVDIDGYNDALLLCRKRKLRLDRREWGRLGSFMGTYNDVKGNGFWELRIFDEDGLRRLRFTSTAIAKGLEGKGGEAYRYIDSMFRKKYGLSMFAAYSGREHKKDYLDIKKCVISPMDYVSKAAIAAHIIEGCYKADVSAAYPSQLCKTLPTLHGCLRKRGRIPPNEKYPFAFYVKARGLSIWTELDTKKDLKHSRFYPYKNNFSRVRKWIPNDDVEEEKETTILCKAADYTMVDIFGSLYNERGHNEEIKLYMNACIGMFHCNSNPILSHIAAVTIARVAVGMARLASKIEAESENNHVILINTDSIIWKGDPSQYAKKKKEMGAFVSEYENMDVCIAGMKAYQIRTSDGQVITRHAGVAKEKLKDVPFGALSKDEAVAVTNVLRDPETGFLKEEKEHG